MKPLPPPQTIPPNLNQNVYYEFHQMPDHTNDNCIRLRHEIQNLIDSKVIDTPPSDKPNTMSNPLPQHNTPFRINQITSANDPATQDFNPTLFIVSDTEPKPIVEISEETTLCFLWEWENTWGNLISDWDEFEAANFQRIVEPPFEPGWEVDWQNLSTDSPWPPESEEEITSSEFNPMDYIVDEAKSEPSVTFLKDANVAMMNLWEDEPGAKQNPWANFEIVNIRIGNEEWTVNKVMMEAEQWKPEDLWEYLVIVDLATNLQDTTIGSKRKALVDLWSEESKYRQIDHLTKSGRVYQPPNLQTGESSNSVAPLAKEPSNLLTTPTKNTFQPFAPLAKEPSHPEKDPEGLIKQQLKQTQAKMSVWDVLVHSTRHCDELIQALSHLKVPSDITLDKLVALIKTITIKHAITFTDQDLPAEGTDHNRPLHVTLKCHGKWVPVILIDNGSAINVCPLRVAYCLGYKNKDCTPSKVKVRAYDNTRRDVIGTLMLPMTFGSYQTEVEFHVSIESAGAVVEGDGDGNGNQKQETGGEDEHRATEAEPCATDKGSDDRAPEAEPRVTGETGAVRSSIELVDTSTVAEDSPVVDGSSVGAGGSGAAGDDLGLIESPPRDPARGKGAVIEGEETTEVPYREEDVLFRPAATLSSHRQITKYGVAEHLPNEALAKVLEDNPMIGEIVLKAKEERARAIAASEAVARAKRKQKEIEELLRDAKAEERAAAKAQWSRVTTVAEAGKLKRPDFSAEAYVPLTPHLFAPSGFATYVPQRTEYDDEVVLRDPEAHIANTWSKVISENPPL
ncbi:hypothetical protein RHMOL_Rhmol01G0225500 [Rhododendron molle]|uniref:Uncharacterized protein n=1 Tax=Rhododendron molle TaxID=49168 RepID=A0ACC0Q414_RHOML|nr:hypothetical protein RHMOL_Rhmol01G0225500 [Rhododendron molle]